MRDSIASLSLRNFRKSESKLDDLLVLRACRLLRAHLPLIRKAQKLYRQQRRHGDHGNHSESVRDNIAAQGFRSEERRVGKVAVIGPEATPPESNAIEVKIFGTKKDSPTASR